MVLGLFTIIMGLITLEQIFDYLVHSHRRRGFKPMLLWAKLFSRSADPLSQEDKILIFGMFLSIGAVGMVFLPEPDTGDPLNIFYGTGVAETPYLMRFEAENYHSNIAEVIFEAVYEAEEEGVGFFLGNVGKNVIDFEASLEQARWARPSAFRFGGVMGETTLGANYTPGPYTAKYALKVNDNTFSGIIARLEAYDPQKKRVLAERTIYYDDFREPGLYQEFPLRFEITRLQPVILRLRYERDAKGELWYDNLTIDSEAEQKVLHERHVYYPPLEDPTASKGAARKATPFDPAGHMLFGINSKELGFGNYEAHFRIKIGDATENVEVAQIEVVDNDNPTDLFIHKELLVEDFKQSNQYETFILPFVQKGRREMDFRVFVSPTVDVWVDSVTIYKEQ